MSESLSHIEKVRRRNAEARVAAMYSELDAHTEEWVEAEVDVPVTPPATQELVKVIVGNDHDALTASMLERLDAMAMSQAETQQALVAALHAIGTRSPEVHVAAPNVDVAAPNVTVEAARPAEINVHVPKQQPADVNVTVTPEITLPSANKTVTFERDILTGQVTKADVVEG